MEDGLVVSTPSAVVGSIPALSTWIFHVQGAADKKVGPIVPYEQIKPVLTLSICYLGLNAING